jgi:hypothetical protein
MVFLARCLGRGSVGIGFRNGTNREISVMNLQILEGGSRLSKVGQFRIKHFSPRLAIAKPASTLGEYGVIFGRPRFLDHIYPPSSASSSPKISTRP